MLSGLAWVILSFLPFGGTSTLVYVLAAVGSGSSTFGYSLIMEEISRGARGRVLSQYAQYARVGSLVATVGVGFLVGDQYSLMRWFFLATGAIYLFSSWISLAIREEEVVVPPSQEVGEDVLRMIGVNTLFYVVWSFAWPLFPLAEVHVYHMDEVNLAFITLIGGVSGLVLQRRIGEWMDRNRRVVMFVGRVALATFPLAYSLADNVYEIYVAYVMMGVTGPVNAIAYTSFVYDNTKNVRKAISFLSVGEGVGSIAGSLLGSLSFVALSAFLPLAVAVRSLLFLAAVMRIGISFLYLSIHDRKEERDKRKGSEAYSV